MLERFAEFVGGITVCYKYIQRIKNAEMTELGLKGVHVSCLFYLNNHAQGLTAAQLCTLCAEDKAAISRVVSQLRAMGYIMPGSKKNYREPLILTEEGKQIAQKMNPLIEAWVGIGGDGLTDSQREVFYETLNIIATNLHHKLGENEKEKP